MRALWFVGLAACGRLGFDDRPVVDAPGPDAPYVAAPVLGPALYVPFETEHGIADVSGRGHALTCDGPCPAAVAGRIGTAASFDAASCVLVDDRDDLQSGDFTIAAWVRVRDRFVGSTAFGRPYMSDTMLENSFELYLGGPQAQNWIILVGGMVDMVPAQLQTWAHLAATSNGSSFTTYVDGQKRGTMFANVVYASEPVRIGCDRDFGVVMSRFVGDIDEVLLYDRILSDAEILTLATAN